MKLNSNPNDASLNQGATQRPNGRVRQNPYGDASTQAGAAAAAQQGAGRMDPSQNAMSSSSPDGVGSVRVSPRTSQLLAAANDTSNDVDMNRVAAIKASIANGTYNINASRIADGMMQSSRDTLKTNNSF